METTISFGYWIRRQRKALDLTQQTLADRVGCSLAAIKKIESDERRPSRQLADLLADTLGVPASQREIFLEVARGIRPIDQLSLAQEQVISVLPTGIVTFLFTDIEDSTKLAQEHPEEWETLRARHHVILHETMEAHNGYVFQVIGDAFCVAFDTANDAFQAAIEAQRKLQTENWEETPLNVRMGIHTGEAELHGNEYRGYLTLSLVERLMSAGHGRQILLCDATENLLRGHLPKDVSLLDLGEHKFKNILQPVRVFQAIAPDLQKEFPALRAQDVLLNNLPIQLTSFIGRKKELDEITNFVAKNRLVTLTGAGGIGKTRLSIQAGFTLLNDFPNGTWLVELAPLSDPTLVPQVIVSTLGLIEQSGRSPLNILTDFLQSKRALLILDNCEHLIQVCAQLAERLLHSCPDLHILATSREALNIAGETLYHVPSLISPEPLNITFDTLPQYEAVQLFVERAQSAMRDFSLTQDNAHAIAQICHHLDGIPLALELAAARVKLLRVEEIAARLDDRFSLLTRGSRTAMPRHQTLQALIDWSHDLLSGPERTLLRRLSVFAGGWTLEAAESVYGGEGIWTHQILDLLTQLINKSLVLAERDRGQETRFHMLETVRQYAQEKLWAAGEGEMLRQQHLAYFVDLAERAEPNLRAFEMVMWLDRLEEEHDNIRTALEWAVESDIEAQLRLASALLWFWHIRGHKNEGVDWLERGLSIEATERGGQPLTPDRAMIRGKALNVAGFLLAALGNFDKGMALLEEALAMFRELGSRGRLGMAYALSNLADAAGNQEDPRRVKVLAKESLALFREAGDKFGMAQCLGILGWVTSLEGDSDSMKALLEENLALRKEIGDKDGIAYVLAYLGRIAFFQGDLSRSIMLYEESLAVFHEVGNEWARGRTLADLARVAQAQGDYGKATKLLEEALVLGRDLGDKFRVSRWLDGLGEVAQSQGDYERATRIYEEALILAREVGDPGTIAHNLSGLGNIALAQGNYPEAAKQFDAELTVGRERKMDLISASALSGLGRVAWAQGDFELSRKRLEKALTINREAGNKIGMGSTIYCLGRVFQSQRDYASACAHYIEALTIARELGYRASILEALATLSVAQSYMEPSLLRFEDLRRATLLFGVAEALYPPLRFEMSAAERAEHDQAIAAAYNELGEESFTAAHEEGKRMTLDEAVKYALNED